MSLVTIRDLHVTFTRSGGTIRAVQGLDLDVYAGECVALVGESGSGKSVTARTLVGLPGDGATVTSERFDIDGRDARSFGPADWRRLRGGFAGLVLQDALVSLDPLRRVGAEVGEALRVHRNAPRRDVVELLETVHVPEPALRARQYPHQLSGGLRQRALIASALAAGPRLLILDEPTTALDVTVQAQILALLAERRARGDTLLLISHDLAVVSTLADRVLVMNGGRAVEEGRTRTVLREPQHPYTRKLISAVPTAVAAPARPAVSDEVVISGRGLRKSYGRRTVVDDVDVQVRRGEIVGVVGESGSGKSTVAHLLFGLLTPTSGTVSFEGTAWSGVSERRRRGLRRRMQLISQDPLSSFDPRWTAGRIVAESGCDPVPLLARVGLDASFADRRPRHLSGGQRQRVAIARALGPAPSLLICDEPVSALDVSVQAQVLDLLADIRERQGTSMLFISHDLAVVRRLADRVLVMRDGRVVESGSTVLHSPRHPYTRALLAAAPTLETAPHPPGILGRPLGGTTS